jgi:hypothetical protein
MHVSKGFSLRNCKSRAKVTDFCNGLKYMVKMRFFVNFLNKSLDFCSTYSILEEPNFVQPPGKVCPVQKRRNNYEVLG